AHSTDALANDPAFVDERNLETGPRTGIALALVRGGRLSFRCQKECPRYCSGLREFRVHISIGRGVEIEIPEAHSHSPRNSQNLHECRDVVNAKRDPWLAYLSQNICRRYAVTILPLPLDQAKLQ